MDPTPEVESHSNLDLETILRSRLWRRLIIAAGVLVLTLLTSLPLYDILSRQRGIPFHEILLPRLLVYSIWGLLYEPILIVARWLRDRTASVPLRAMLLVPFTVLVAAGLARVDEQVYESSRQRFSQYLRPDESPTPRLEGEPNREREETDRRRRPRRDERRGEDRRSRWWERGQRIRNFGRSLTELWFLLAVGAGIEAFLRGRGSERNATALAVHSARLETELARAQLGSLARQLNPHFLFNALHSIGGLVRTGDDKRALAVLSDISSLLRLTLRQGELQEQSLADELEVTERYLALEQLRLGERLETEIDAEDSALAGALPSLLLLPLVENAVRHGIAHREEGGRVTVTARREGAQLVIVVRDNGPGFDSAEGEGTGIGLANGRKRLAMLYGEEAALRIETDAGARVQVSVPWHTLDEEAL